MTKRREQENTRLRARYATVTKQLVEDAAHSLDTAVERLMEHPDLAEQLIRSAIAHPVTAA
jgi:hypothetical protein